MFLKINSIITENIVVNSPIDCPVRTFHSKHCPVIFVYKLKANSHAKDSPFPVV
jgi:hypothetical protein